MKLDPQNRVGFSRTIEEVRAWFDVTGTTYKAWAQAHGYDANVVGDLLRGKTLGRRGMAHNVAVELGLKFGWVNPANVPAKRKGKT
jgi:gp16 family phage-associated protein